MGKVFNNIFIIIWLLLQSCMAMAYVPRENTVKLSKDEANNVITDNYIDLSRKITRNPNLVSYLYTITDFDNLSLENIDNLSQALSGNSHLINTLQNYYRPKSIVSLVEKIENLNLNALNFYREQHPQNAQFTNEILSLAIDSVATDILFEEYLYLRACKLFTDINNKNNSYISGKTEYVASLRQSIDEYLDYENKLFNAVFYLESMKAYARLNTAFSEMVKIYSQYEAPNTMNKMKEGFEKLVNGYDSEKNLSIIAKKMKEFEAQCNLNRQLILESFLLSNESAPKSARLGLKYSSPHKYKYQATTKGFNDFYSYKSSLDKKNATAGLASSVVGLFTGFLGSVVVDAASGAYKSSNIKEIANKDFDTRKVYIQDAYNKSCTNLNDQLSKLENNLRKQYNQNVKKLKNELSNLK